MELLPLKSYPNGPRNPEGISESPEKQTRDLISGQHVSNYFLGSGRVERGGLLSSGNALSDLD